jgi:phenylacetate-CoA ligase
MDIEPPKVVVTTAEPLYEAWRTKIETVLTTCVYDRYASREVGHIAQECYRHSSLHINAESIYVEIVENGEIVEPGQIGEIVVTDLMNYGMPLLRYRIEDRGTLVKGSCGCGLELPMMEVNGGRINDFFLKSDGSKLHGNCITDFAIASWKKIKQMQFIQETVENFRVKVVPGPEFQESTMEAIKCELEKKMEQNINLRIEIVNEIPAEESGKYRITKSLVCEEEGQDSYESLFH